MSEEEENWEELIEIPEKGVFVVKYHQLTLKALKNKASRLRTRMIELQRKEARNLVENQNIARQLAHLSKINYDGLIQSENRRTQEAIEKANQFMKGWIGQTNYERLQKDGFFIFEANGKKYRIKQNGQLQEDGGKYWYNLCTIKPNVPVPDIIASTFSAVEIHSHDLFSSTRKRETNEEVTQ